MKQTAFLRQFFSDVYKGQHGDAVFVHALAPFRCETVPVEKAPAFRFDFERELFFTVSSYNPGAVQKTGEGRNKAALSSCGVIHLDFDTKRFDDPAEFFHRHALPAPSYAFKRADRVHVYWLLDKPCTDFVELERITKALAKKTGADALPAHPAALMRVPFTAHVKKGKRGPGYTPVLQNRRRHPLALFVKPDAPGAAPHTDNGKTGVTAPGASGFDKILLKSRGPVAAGAGRSAALYQFALRCRDFGLEEKEAQECAEKFNALYCTPPEPPAVVRHQTASAYKYAKHPPGRYLSERPERVAQKFENDTKLAESLSAFVFVADAEILIDTKTGLRYTKASQIENALCYAAGVKTSLQYVLTFRLISQRDKIAFRPDHGREFDEHGITWFNTFDAVQTVEKTKEKKNAVKIFEDHLRYLSNTETEFEHLRKFLASAFLRPGRKIKHALLLISTYEGIGKSVLQALSEKILVSVRGAPYVVSTSNTEIARGHNSWVESKFLTFVHELGQSEKFAVLDQLKNWITEPRVRISDKYVKSYEIDNHCNFIFFSNAPNALPISGTDRRFFIILNRKPPQSPAYYTALMKAFDDGLFSIVQYLEKFADDLNINAAPPVTESKQELRTYSKNELTIFLDECLHDPAFKDFFAGEFTIKTLAERTQDSARASNVRFSQKQAALWLRENQFFQHRTAHSRAYRREKSNITEAAGRFKARKKGDK